MVASMSTLLFMSMYFAVLCASPRINRTVYQPYGPAMCTKLSRDVQTTFAFMMEELSCRLLNGGTLSCHENIITVRKTSDLLTGWQICRSHIRVAESMSTEEVNEDSCTIALQRACRAGNLCMVDYILSNGLADINCKGEKGSTPVMVAAEENKVLVFDFLLNKNCNLSDLDDRKDTVLHRACVGGNAEIVKKLMTKVKYLLEKRGRNSWTPVMNAVYLNHRDAVEILVGEGCNLTLVDVDGDSLLHLACIKGNVEMVKYILQKGVIDIDLKGQYGWTPAMKAAYTGHREVVDLFVGEGCNLRLVDDNGDNIVHLACQGGNVDLVKYLLWRGEIDINSKGKNGWTPAMWAAFRGRLNVLKFLVQKGCNLEGVSNYMDTIIHVACRAGHLDVMEYILSMGKFKLEERAKYGRTPVMIAGKHGHLQMIKYLVDKGCNLTSVDDNKDNILHLASYAGTANVVRYILSLDIFDIDAKGRYGKTAALKAASGGCLEVLKLLVRKGSKLTAVEDNKNTMLHLACIGGHVDVVRYLITLNVFSGEEKNKYGLTPYYIAVISAKKRVLSLLKRMKNI